LRTQLQAAETPWRRGRFDTRVAAQRLLFGHMYEDVAVEARAFAPGGQVFCIASAGDTALALAEHHRVVAVDINPVQLAYAQTRLDGAAARTGTAERLMGFGRSLLPLAGWHRARVEKFLAFDSAPAQLAFWHAHLDTRRFRAGVDLLLSVTGLRRVYASPFLSVLPPHFGAVMRARMERCFARHPNATNPYARALLLGDFPPAPRPGQAVELICADAAGYLEAAPASSFDGFTLSNVLDGAPPAYRTRLLSAVRRAATPAARLVLRSFAQPSQPSASNFAADDRSMLWGSVEVTGAAAST
jgi:S-adenosylmethionine:diacylglycerol 3-amino-3-carboxypropyl transferase